MTDRAYEPADVNPFHQFNDDGGETAPEKTNPFHQFNTDQDIAPAPQTGAVSTFAKSAAKSALPAIGSFPAIGAGAEIGGGIGAAVGGPLAPVTAPVGALIGGAAGAIGGSYALSKVQDWALSQLPDTWKEKLGIDEKQEQLEQKEHPTAAFLGGLVPYAVTLRPGLGATTKLPENATALQRIMANKVTARLFGGAAMGGMELGQEKVEGQPADWQRVGIATAFGLVFNQPTKLGEALTESGGRRVRPLIGRPEPTVSQAADAKVMGPGITEDVFQGAHEQDPSAAMTAQETVRQEQAATGITEPAPDIRVAARATAPEAFDLWDDLHARETMLRDWVAENPEAETAKAHLADTQKQIADLSPEISAAYRRAAESLGTATVEPQRFGSMAEMLAAQGRTEGQGVQVGASETVAPQQQPRTIEQQRAYIANDVAQKLIAAGRSPEEAQAGGAIMAARYETRAARFNGALGTAEELYRREGPEIRGTKPPTEAAPTAAAPPVAPAPSAGAVEPTATEAAPEPEPAVTAPSKRNGPASRDPNTFSLLEFLASRGGIRNDDALIEDLKGSFGGKNKFIPGFGQLIRSPGEVSTAAFKSGRRAALSLDAAREAAIEDGYLPRDASINDLLEAIDQETRGARVYREGYLPEGRAAEPAELERHKDDFLTTLDDMVAENGGHLTRKERARALEIWQKEGINDHAAILERLFLEARDDAVDSGVTLGEEPIAIPGWDDAVGVGPPRTGGLVSEISGTQGAAGGASGRPRGEGARAEVEEYFQRRKQPPNLIAERETEGQLGLPGTERISQGELAQRKANEPLKPSAEQKPMDEGLFGTAKDQKELFQTQQGKIAIREGAKPIITLARTADASTFIHETGHLFLEEVMRDAEHELAPDTLKADAATVKDWLGVEGADDIKTRQHEKFARGFEQYLREGIAPSLQLASVFAKFKDWLLRIYQSLKGLGPEITPDIRNVFDRLLASEPQRTVIAPDLAKRPTLQDIHESDANLTEPHEAAPVMDRTLAEADRFVAEPPPEVANEIAEAEAKIQATTGEAGIEPAGETGLREGAGGQVQPDRGGPELKPAGGAVRAERGAELPGGGAVGGKGGELPGSEPGGARAESGAGLEDKPLAPRPAALFGPDQSPFLDKAGNIRLDTLTTDSDVRQALRAAASENDDFIGDRRGVVTDGQVMDLAADLGMVGAERLVRERVVGQAFNAEQVMALRKLLIQSATEVSAAMKKAAAGTDEDVLAYAAAKDRHQLIQATVSQATAEAGRALRAFRNLTGTEGNVDQFLREATGKTLFQLRREAKLGAALDTPQQVSKFVNDSRQPTFWRMLLEYWVNGLISGPATHTTYTIGNNLLMLEKLGPETAAAAGVGAIRRMFGREGETVRLGEVAAGLAGMRRGVGPALTAAVEAFKTGTTTALPGENVQNILPFQYGAELATPGTTNEAAKVSDALGSAFGMFRGIWDSFIAGGGLLTSGGVEGSPFVGLRYSHLGVIPDIELRGINVAPIGTAIRLPSRFIAAIHSYFRVMNYSVEKNAQAYRIAANEGLTGEAFDSRVGDLRQNPTAAMMQSGYERANQLTLMGQGGEFTQALSRLTNTPIFGIPIFKFIDPFVKISSNVIEQSLVQRTPLGILSPEIRADLSGKNGNVAQDMATARMLVGTAYALAIGGLAAEGYVSGSGPTDPKQAAVWRLAGNQAHSVRIGDIWYDVHRLGPLGMLMGVAADMYEVAHKASEGQMLEAASHLQHAVTQNILDESFMRGPSDLIKAVDDPGRYGEAYIRNFLSGFVPYSVGLSQMARATDPYSRQARSVMDAIKQKIPGLSEELLPRRDIWGEAMPNKAALGAAGVTAIYEQRMSHDPVNLALLDLGIAPAQVTRKIRNVQLTDQQFDDFTRIAGRMTKMRLDAIVNSADFRAWPNHIKRDVITEVISQSREAARGMMLMKYPQIVKDATTAKLKKLQD
jgi:hypothetical protein